MTAYNQRTVIQTFDPNNGDRFVQLVELDGISLPLDSYMPLTIDGKHWTVVGRRSVSIDTHSPQGVVTLITVMKDVVAEAADQ